MVGESDIQAPRRKIDIALTVAGWLWVCYAALIGGAVWFSM
jgi:hypothetical protein